LDLIERLGHRLFGEPLVMNVYRGELVEEICLMGLEPDWRHVGGDYGHCDLVHAQTGLEMQIKQSAALQSWGLSKTAPRFSIAYKTGKWIDGNNWRKGRSRNADIFTFAWHPQTDHAADHRDPEQWEYYLVAERALPQQDSIRDQEIGGEDTLCGP